MKRAMDVLRGEVLPYTADVSGEIAIAIRMIKRSLPDRQVWPRAIAAIADVYRSPHSGEKLKHDEEAGAYSARFGDYRILYDIEGGTGRPVLRSIAHRREAYKSKSTRN